MKFEVDYSQIDEDESLFSPYSDLAKFLAIGAKVGFKNPNEKILMVTLEGEDLDLVMLNFKKLILKRINEGVKVIITEEGNSTISPAEARNFQLPEEGVVDINTARKLRPYLMGE